MIRAITLDIDGTITHQNRKLDISAVEAIRKAEEAGVLICLATGNILCFARTASVLLGTSGPIIAEDGGVVYNQAKREKHILGELGDVDKGIELLEEEIGNIQHTETSHRRHRGRTLERTIDVSEANEIFQQNGLDLTAVDSGFAIHVKDISVNKGEALRKVSSILEIPISEIASIGDAQNDVEMLQLSGLSFTPSNASNEAKKASSETTEKQYGEGVKKAIGSILEERK